MDEMAIRAAERLMVRRAEEELAACNDLTVPYGLTLSAEERRDLAEELPRALRASGRVEFGSGILRKLILAFRDSPYLAPENYARTLSGLQEAFYLFKNESEERLSDDELLDWMRGYFDWYCQGDVEYLTGTTLTELCRALREGEPARDVDPRNVEAWYGEE